MGWGPEDQDGGYKQIGHCPQWSWLTGGEKWAQKMRELSEIRKALEVFPQEAVTFWFFIGTWHHVTFASSNNASGSGSRRTLLQSFPISTLSYSQSFKYQFYPFFYQQFLTGKHIMINVGGESLWVHVIGKQHQVILIASHPRFTENRQGQGLSQWLSLLFQGM